MGGKERGHNTLASVGGRDPRPSERGDFFPFLPTKIGETMLLEAIISHLKYLP